MQTLELTQRMIQLKELNKKSPLDSDTTQVIDQPTIFKLKGEVVMVYGKFPHPYTIEVVREACKKIRYEKSDRTAGLKTESRIFGFKPRRVIRGDFCSSTMLAKESPIEHAAITQLGGHFCKLYDQYLPHVFKQHLETVLGEVLPEWIIPGTIFTSGIVNKSNSLKYHLDSGNFKDCMSCMLVLRKDVEGGMLSIPEFDLRLDLQDSTYLIFDGQKILHGVTQIRPMNKFSYRYSIVFYSLKQMCNCMAFGDELQRVRKVKKAREEKRLIKDRTDL
jgi:hypothetical protein